MEIGILTLPFNNNYGGYLQAYALMTILKNMGHEVELIYRRHNRRPFSFRLKTNIKNIIKYLLGKRNNFIICDQEKELRQKGEFLMSFVDSKICPKTKPLYSTKELSKTCKERYDAIIVGSDQVWRPDYVPNIENFFLDFVENEDILKIAYAASFGERHPHYTNEQIAQCGELLSHFDIISLREESGKDVIKDFNWDIYTEPAVVLDPTMLLDKEHYESLMFKEKKDKDRYVLSYVLDESRDVQNLTSYVISALNLQEKKIIDTKIWKSPKYKMPSIESWLQAIHDADFVITDSFHGTVFSILFNIPFITYVNKGRGADRFYTLLGHFGLESRMITTLGNVSEILTISIKWEEINKIIQKEKLLSIGLLATINNIKSQKYK